MGNQGHATEGARLTNEWIQAGVIGDGARGPRLVRPGRPPLEAGDRPADATRRRCPPTLDWDLWLGPIRERPYHPAYAPVSWRGWWDFGTGALGDMGCHIIDHPVWALDLGAPSVVEARTTLDGSFLDGNKPNFETYPIAAIIYYDFPERGKRPAVRMTWYDGGLMPPTPAEMPAADQRLPDNGVLYVGSKGMMYHSSHGGMPQLLPARAARGGQEGPEDDGPLAGPLRGVGRCLQGRTASGLELRLRRPADRDRAAGSAGPAIPGAAAGVGQREPEGQERAGTEPVCAAEYRKGWSL